MAIDNVYWFAEDGTVQHMSVVGTYVNANAHADLEIEIVRLPIYTRHQHDKTWFAMFDKPLREFGGIFSGEVPESIKLYRLLAGDDG